MKMHAFSIKETVGIQRTNQFVQTGLPLPQGTCRDVSQLRLVDENNTIVQSHIQPLAMWPDNSVSWCLVSLDIDLQSSEEKKLFIEKNDSDQSTADQSESVAIAQNLLTASTQHHTFSIDLENYNFLQTSGFMESGACELLTSNHGQLSPKIEDYSCHSRHSQERVLFSEVNLKGSFQSSTDEACAHFDASYLFHNASSTVNYSITIHNPKSAHHPEGIWDLGEENSLYIQSFALGFETDPVSGVFCQLTDDAQWQSIQGNSLTVYQESSGGEHWNSPIHKNKNDVVPLKHKGFIFKHNNQSETGLRASPVIKLQHQNKSLNFRINDFWQNFPKAIDIQHQQIRLEIFPAAFPDDIELQPGEKKTHSMSFSFGDEQQITTPVQTRINREWINHCHVLPFTLSEPDNDLLDSIIQNGLDGTANFYVKREAIDEYGWRNYGELFADHETAFHEKDGLFISHYNNQYDPIYGFITRYLKTGDSRWFELADDLAKHVLDIDIYHTDQDKDDYNRGMFWHTDHYLEAGLATHRSFSKLQPKNAYMDHAGGGGPGGQHGYTSGLLFYYLLTGNSEAKAAVLSLTDWLQRYYDGTDSFLGFLNAIKNRYRADLKDITTGQYPLDRGTGNYLNALLDKYTLTQLDDDLKKVIDVIRHTVHPHDDLEKRDLFNIEEKWFYTVFFQNVGRYLQVKEQNQQLDDDFYYARDCLLHYADWMAEYEYFYLDKPEQLEFANHTWTAQEIRKVVVLKFANYYSPEQAVGYLNKANEIHNRLVGALKQEPTRHYTRIQAILMQSAGIAQHEFPTGKIGQFAERRQHGNPPRFSPLSKLGRLFSISVKLLLIFSFKREKSWLKRHTSLLN